MSWSRILSPPALSKMIASRVPPFTDEEDIFAEKVEKLKKIVHR